MSYFMLFTEQCDLMLFNPILQSSHCWVFVGIKERAPRAILLKQLMCSCAWVGPVNFSSPYFTCFSPKSQHAIFINILNMLSEQIMNCDLLWPQEKRCQDLAAQRYNTWHVCKHSGSQQGRHQLYPSVQMNLIIWLYIYNWAERAQDGIGPWVVMSLTNHKNIEKR
jgi:hypothetical protein